MCQLIMDRNGELMKGKEEVRNKQRDYVNTLLNFRGTREAQLSCLERGVWSERIVSISEKEVWNSLKKMKNQKSVEFLIKGGEIGIKWPELFCFVSEW